MNFSIFNIINKLPKLFRKDELQLSIQQTKQKLLDSVLDLLEINELGLKGVKPSDPDVINYMTVYSKEITKVTTLSEWYTDIKESVEKQLKMLEIMSDIIDKKFNVNESTISITYDKLAVVNMIQMIEFTSEYVLCLMSFIYDKESDNLSKSEDDDLIYKVKPVTIRYLAEKFNDFKDAIVLFKKPIDTIKSRLESIPAAIISEQTDMAIRSNNSAINDFSVRNASIYINPFYLRALWKIRQNKERHEYEKNQVEYLKLQLADLQEKLKGNPDNQVIKNQLIGYKERLVQSESRLNQMKLDFNL